MNHERHKEDSELSRPNKWFRLSNALHTSAVKYDLKFPFFRQPVEVGSFSQDEKRQFHEDRRQLRDFIAPLNASRVRFDLRKGYKNMIRRDENVKEYINDLLRWVIRNKKKFISSRAQQHDKVQTQCDDQDDDKTGVFRSPSNNDKFTSLNTDFVCWRGLLTRLLCVPYENREDLLIAVIRYRGTYFMCEFDTEAKKRQKEMMTQRQDEMCAWGWKFEQYVTADKSRRIPDTDSPVNNNEAFCSVVRSRLSSHSLVYGAEVDCEDPSAKTGNRYLELKTSRLIESERQHENFCKFKLIKWWAQSFLIGIPRVVCGFRDDDGIVRKLQDFAVQEMTGLVNNSLQNPWKATVCFNFLNSFLEFVKSNITEDNEKSVYLLRWRPGEDVTCERSDSDGTFHFLPDWFLNWDAWDTYVSV